MNSLEAQILVKEKALYRAQKASDVSALNELIHTDLLFTGPDGQLHGKEEDLALHRSRAIVFEVLEPQDPQIKILTPDVAVASVKVQVGARFNGQYSNGLCRYTRVWQHVQGRWQIVAGHVSLVP